MRIWLIHLGELLPIDGSVRAYRNSMLARAACERGHDVVQWAPTFSHQEKRQRANRDIDIELHPRHRLRLLWAPGYAKNLSAARIQFHRRCARAFLRSAVTADRPDIILSAMPTPEMCMSALRYSSGAGGVPVVIDVRDLWPDALLDVVSLPSRVAMRPVVTLTDQWNRRIFRHARGVMAISDEFLSWGLRFAGRQRGSTDAVFPLAHEASGISPLERREAVESWSRRGVDGSKKIVCFAGTISRQFNLEGVLQAARDLHVRGRHDIQFVVCGAGDSFDRHAAAANLLPNVVFPGWLPLPEIAVLLEWACVALAPYRPGTTMSQRLGNKPFEYFAAGIPVISTKGGELERLLERAECGLSYRADAPASLVQCILALVDNPERREAMGERARRLFEERYAASHVYPAMVDHLETLAAVPGTYSGSSPH